jgi:hypothetical protein
MASIQTKSCASSFQDVSNFSWHIGHGALANAESLGTGMNLFLGSFLAAIAAAIAFEASKSFGDFKASSSVLSLDLIHSYNTSASYCACFPARTLTISSTYQLLLWPRLAESASRWFVRKCQSKWRAFFALPSSVARKRRPQVEHWFGWASYIDEIRWGRGLLYQ